MSRTRSQWVQDALDEYEKRVGLPPLRPVCSDPPPLRNNYDVVFVRIVPRGICDWCHARLDYDGSCDSCNNP